MRRRSQTRKLIQTCYYRFKIHKLSCPNLQNPLLIPNSTQHRALKPLLTKKHQNIHDHNKTISHQNANFLRQFLSQDKTSKKEKMDKKNEGQAKRLSGKQRHYLAQQKGIGQKQYCKYIHIKRSSMYNQSRYLNSLNNSKLQKLTLSQINYLHDNNSSQFVNNQSQKCQKRLQNQKSTKKHKTQRSEQSKIKIPIYRCFPNKKVSLQQNKKSQYNLSFRSWGRQPSQPQYQSNITSIKYK